MKFYENPTLDIIKLTAVDTITASDLIGTELPLQEETNVGWQ